MYSRLKVVIMFIGGLVHVQFMIYSLSSTLLNVFGHNYNDMCQTLMCRQMVLLIATIKHYKTCWLNRFHQ